MNLELTEVDKLLIEIARCDNFLYCKNCACKKIIDSQKQTDKQLPEPWNGDIKNSKILFISSNPSINEDEIYPVASWKDNDIIDFFHNRFSVSRDYVKNFLYPKHKNGYAKQWVRYWGFVRSISRKLLDKQNVIPGVDYSLMEIVHCKSHNEYGVNEALDVCAEKYLERTLKISKARVIVAVGNKSRDILSKKLNIEFEANSHIEQIVGGTERIIFTTPHSNARGKRTLQYILNDESIDYIKKELEM